MTPRDRYERLLSPEAFRLTSEDVAVIEAHFRHYPLVSRLIEEVRALWEDEAERDYLLAGGDIFHGQPPPGKTGTIKVRLRREEAKVEQRAEWAGVTPDYALLDQPYATWAAAMGGREEG